MCIYMSIHYYSVRSLAFIVVCMCSQSTMRYVVRYNSKQMNKSAANKATAIKYV